MNSALTTPEVFRKRMEHYAKGAIPKTAAGKKSWLF